MIKLLLLGIFIGYVFGNLLPFGVTENPNTLPFEQRKHLIY